MNDIILRRENLGLSWGQDPFDMLYQMNPEIASLALAHIDGILTPEILPYVARFRELQSDEKIALMQHITDNLRIDADVEMNNAIYRTQQNIVRLQTEGVIEKAKIDGAALLDVSRLKYASRVKIVQEQVDGQKYISDNQLKATYIEAQALRDSIIKSEEIKALARENVSKNDLVARVKEAEYNYLARINEAETIRSIEDQRNTSSVVESYLTTQGEMYRALIDYQIRMRELDSEESKAAYGGLAKMTGSACNLLGKREDIQEVSVDAETPVGQVKLNVKLNKDKNDKK